MPHETLIAQLEDGERRARALAAMPREKLVRPYAPGKWSGLQVLNHMADTDAVLLYRFMKAIAEEGEPIVPFDQDRWVAELCSDERPPELALAFMAATRGMLIWFLRTLPDEAMLRKTHHPERGEMTALRIAQMVAGHATHHLEQIEAIRDGRNWTPKPATY